VPYFPLKNWAFEIPLSLGISVNLPWGGYGYFLAHTLELSRLKALSDHTKTAFLTLSTQESPNPKPSTF